MRSIIRTYFSHSLALIALLLLSSFSGSAVIEPVAPEMEGPFSRIVSEGLSSKALLQAVNGYATLKEKHTVEKDVLVVIDYTKSSNAERFYVLDMRDTSLTYSLIVAHGRNTGDEFATSFSNQPGSYMSSLGFFKTAETYDGKHGLSLRLDGLERGINHLARERAIVIHQADYVSMDFAAEHGRIGRSLGCPALPQENYSAVIDLIKDGCLLYIFGGDEHYASQSAVLSKS